MLLRSKFENVLWSLREVRDPLPRSRSSEFDTVISFSRSFKLQIKTYFFLHAGKINLFKDIRDITESPERLKNQAW